MCRDSSWMMQEVKSKANALVSNRAVYGFTFSGNTCYRWVNYKGVRIWYQVSECTVKWALMYYYWAMKVLEAMYNILGNWSDVLLPVTFAQVPLYKWHILKLSHIVGHSWTKLPVGNQDVFHANYRCP